MNRNIAKRLSRYIDKEVTVRTDGDDIIAEGPLRYNPAGSTSSGYFVDTYALSVESVQHIFTIHQGESARIELKSVRRAA